MGKVCPEEGKYILGECLPPISTLVMAFVGPFWAPKWLDLAIHVTIHDDPTVFAPFTH